MNYWKKSPKNKGITEVKLFSFHARLSDYCLDLFLVVWFNASATHPTGLPPASWDS